MAGKPCRRVSFGLLALAQVAAAQEAVTAERVRAAYADACAAVASTLAFRPEPALELRFVEPAELAARVAEENLPLVRLRQSDPARAEAEARQLGAAFAQLAFAKYAWSTRELLVLSGQWELQAERLDRPEMCDDGTLRAVLVHELVHARDDAEFGLSAVLQQADSNDATSALNALIEGHAQFLARRVCAAAGWTEGFEAFTGAIGALPESTAELDEFTRTILRVQSAALTSAYHQGERFVAALEAAGGPERVARAFREPPRDGETIAHPEWYLDPGTRPRVLYDAEPALAHFAARFPAEVWSAQRLSLAPAQIEAALALLPRETVASVVGTLRASRLISLQPSAAPGSKVVALVVMEFEGAAGAQAYLAAARELGRRKDELMKEGQVRVLGSRTTELEAPGVDGFLVRRQMKNGALTFEAITLDAARGTLVLETVFSGEAIADEAHVALVGELFERIRLRADGSAR